MLHFSFNITEKSGLYEKKIQKIDFDKIVERKGFFEDFDSILKCEIP